MPRGQYRNLPQRCGFSEVAVFNVSVGAKKKAPRRGAGLEGAWAPLSSDSAVESRGDLAEVAAEAVTESLECNDDGDSDECSDEAVLDCGDTLLLTDKTNDRHSELHFLH